MILLMFDLVCVLMVCPGHGVVPVPQQGIGGLEQNYTLSRKYLCFAGSRGVSQAYEALGVMDLHGLGLEEPNVKRAKYFLERACTPNALTIIGEMYQYGYFSNTPDLDRVGPPPSPCSLELRPSLVPHPGLPSLDETSSDAAFAYFCCGHRLGTISNARTALTLLPRPPPSLSCT